VFCVDQGRSWCLSADGFVWLGGRTSFGDLQGLFWLRDLGHGGLGEEAPALQLPFLLLLQQLAAHQPRDRGVVGEDADHVGAPFDLLVQALERVGAPDLAPVLLGEVQERQHVVAGGLHHRHGAGELLAQHLGDPLPVGAHLIGGLDHEHRFHGGGHHVLASLGDVGQEVAQEMHPAALPAAALEHPLDRRRQPQVGIGDHQPGAIQATLLEAGEELAPEGLGLAVAHGDAEHLAVAESIDADRHHHRTGADLHVAAETAVEVGGVEVVVGEAGVVERCSEQGHRSAHPLPQLRSEGGEPSAPA